MTAELLKTKTEPDVTDSVEEVAKKSESLLSQYYHSVLSFFGVANAGRMVELVTHLCRYLDVSPSGNTVILHKKMKDEICKGMNLKEPRLNKMFAELKRCSIIVPMEDMRGLYKVNPLILPADTKHEIQDLTYTVDISSHKLSAQITLLSGDTKVVEWRDCDGA